MAEARLHVASGISIPLIEGWAVTDALEIRSPEGLVLGVTTYPTRAGVDALALAGQDAPEGFDASGDPQSEQLFEGLESVIRRYQSTSGEKRSQLVAYSTFNGRAVVARATAPTEDFEAAEPRFLELISQISVGGPGSDTEGSDEIQASDHSQPAFVRFIAGENGLLELPEISGNLDVHAVGQLWKSAETEAESEPDHRFYLSGAELHAVARLYGQSSFPGVASNPEASTTAASAVETTARSALLSRGLLTAVAADRIQLSASVSDFAVRAFHAHLIIEISVVRDGSLRRLIVFVPPEMTSANIEPLPGNVYQCAVGSVGHAIGRLLDLVDAEESDIPEGPDRIVVDSEGRAPSDVGEPNAGGICEVTLVHGEKVFAETFEWIDFPDVGRYIHDKDDLWVACSPRELFNSMITAVTGVGDTDSG